jgi:RyR domain
MATYTPKPIDTSNVVLNDAQRRLVEQLAANVHDVWARKRVEDGWRHGASRNDQIKTHPSLVPYDELPDSEKDYDRVMVEQVIRAAVALGYRIDALDPAGRAGRGRPPAGHWLARLRGGFSNRETTQT